MKHIISIIISISLFCSCNSKSQTNQNKISKAKDTPEIRALLKRFNEQKHRLEINDCEIVYNGKSFFLGNTIEQLSQVLGKPSFEHKNGAMWSQASVDARVRNNKVFNIYVYINEGGYKNIIKPNSNIILINGIPLTKEMVFNDFLNNSNYSFKDFYIDKYSFYLKPENCNLHGLHINFDSKPFYHYSGSGHMRIRGDFDSSQTNPVKNISIFQHEKEN